MKERKRLGRPKGKERKAKTFMMDVELVEFFDALQDKGMNISEIINPLLANYKYEYEAAYSDTFNDEII